MQTNLGPITACIWHKYCSYINFFPKSKDMAFHSNYFSIIVKPILVVGILVKSIEISFLYNCLGEETTQAPECMFCCEKVLCPK